MQAIGSDQFFAALYRDVAPDLLVSVSYRQNGAFRHEFYRAGDFARNAPGVAMRARAAKTADAYFRQTLIAARPAKGRGDESLAVMAPAVWIDLDASAPYRRREGLAPIDWILDTLLPSLTPAPSIVVNSGGGIHAYWLLDTPARLASDSDRAAFKTAVHRFQSAISARLLAAGYLAADPTQDLARILRVPESLNVAAEEVVTILSLDPERRYTIADLLAEAPEVPAAAPVVRMAPTRPPELPASRSGQYIAAVVEAECATVAAARSGERNNTLNRSAFALGRIAHLGLSEHEACAALWQAAQQCGLDDTEFSATFASGWAGGLKAPRQIEDRPHPAQSRQSGATSGGSGGGSALAEVVPMPEAPRAPLTGLAQFPCSDSGNAELMVHLYGGDWKYDHITKTWYEWDESIWVSREKSEVDDIAKNAARERGRVTPPGASDADLAKWKSWSLRSEDDGKILAALRRFAATPDVRISYDQLDRDPHLFACQNGVIDLRQQSFRDASRSDYMTRRSKVRYEHGALAPRWEQFISEASDENATTIEFLHRMLGYTLLGQNPSHAWVMLHGAGSNGKGTVMNTLKEVMGGYAVALSEDAINAEIRSNHTEDLSHIQGCRYVYISETSPNLRLNTARIKSIAAADEIRVRGVYQRSRAFRPNTHLWISTQYMPVLSDLSHGFRRRMHIVPFTRLFESTGNELYEILVEAEGPGILNWFVAGYAKWAANRFDGLDAIRDYTNAIFSESDPVGQFLAACTVKKASAPGVQVSNLHGHFTRWYTRHFPTGGEPMGLRAFGQRLEAEGMPKRKTAHGIVWTGIDLVPYASDED